MSILNIFKKRGINKTNTKDKLVINDDTTALALKDIKDIDTKIIVTNEIDAKKNTIVESVDDTHHRPKTNQKEMVNSSTTQLPNTIYNAVVRIRKNNFSRKDLRNISHIVLKKFKLQNPGTDLEKVPQQEGDKIFEVYSYPHSMRKTLLTTVQWYYTTKEARAGKHSRLTKTETLTKLKKINSPDYEMELVKFNMAEEERRKQEKIKKTQEVKQQKINSKNPRQSKNTNRGNYSTNNVKNNKPAATFTKRKFTSSTESNTNFPKKTDG